MAKMETLEELTRGNLIWGTIYLDNHIYGNQLDKAWEQYQLSKKEYKND